MGIFLLSDSDLYLHVGNLDVLFTSKPCIIFSMPVKFKIYESSLSLIVYNLMHLFWMFCGGVGVISLKQSVIRIE